MIQPVILCGGYGTRLWPLSRPNRPKAFLKLLGERTLFQQALDRVADPAHFAQPIVVAGRDHANLVAEQAVLHSLIVEPEARDTAPAIALAAARLSPETVLLVCPSDHYIADREAFLRGVASAETLAAEGWLVCFGVNPDRAETGYGYIELGDSLRQGNRIARFVEKPDADTARSYVARGDFVWNAGIFVLRAGDYLSELEKQRPEMARWVRLAVDGGHEDRGAFHPAVQEFCAIEGESVDYAVMENTQRAAVVSADMGWTDVGNWDALRTARTADGKRKVVSAGNAELIDCRGVMIESDGPRVSAVGLRDVTIVVDGDEVLVVAHGSASNVAKLRGIKGE
ncbi:mannose-1-phosphate guanylyltransferase [Qipengyuania huizhouensis]|uniref:mannose-1-phosphate guanylyltransferase n=1 Tax=Qipengyuania huizhouensis TaxID=2867245 RepID=UPI0031E545F9